MIKLVEYGFFVRYKKTLIYGVEMNNKELEKLSRSDLLEILIQLSEELNETKEKLADAQVKLNEREIKLEKAGSIAEASLNLNGVFEAAEAAGQQYLDNIKKLSERQKVICARLEKESMDMAAKMLTETKEKCEKLEAETKAKCEELVAKAETESKEYWNNVHKKLENYYKKQNNIEG